MSLANSKTRRAEPRTAADLAERGFKLVSIGRPSYFQPADCRVCGGDGFLDNNDLHAVARCYSCRGTGKERGRAPMEYKLVRLGSDDRTGSPYSRERNGKWFGVIKGRPSASTAHLPLKKGYGHSQRPMAGGPFESRVAAAHAILDHLGL